MIALPAIDLRDGACVQLVGGSYANERVRIDDPVAQAQVFVEQGFSAIHVVDLDAATGNGDNNVVIDALFHITGLTVQVGGGVRTLERAQQLIDKGARAVVVGTRAIEDPAFVSTLAEKLDGRVIVALDVRGTRVLTRGWAEQTELDIVDALARLRDVNLAGVLVTAVHVEGALQGIDANLYRKVIATTRHPVLASGGVTTMQDLDVLATMGAAGAVIGMALYTGRLDGNQVARAYSAKVER